jgi:hypothetical protein
LRSLYIDRLSFGRILLGLVDCITAQLTINEGFTADT